MLDLRHDLSLGGGVRGELVGYDPLWRTACLRKSRRQQTLRRLCIAVDLHDFVEHIPVLIDGAPKIALLATDGHDDLIAMPDVITRIRFAFKNKQAAGACFWTPG